MVQWKIRKNSWKVEKCFESVTVIYLEQASAFSYCVCNSIELFTTKWWSWLHSLKFSGWKSFVIRTSGVPEICSMLLNILIQYCSCNCPAIKYWHSSRELCVKKQKALTKTNQREVDKRNLEIHIRMKRRSHNWWADCTMHPHNTFTWIKKI